VAHHRPLKKRDCKDRRKNRELLDSLLSEYDALGCADEPGDEMARQLFERRRQIDRQEREREERAELERQLFLLKSPASPEYIWWSERWREQEGRVLYGWGLPLEDSLKALALVPETFSDWANPAGIVNVKEVLDLCSPKSKHHFFEGGADNEMLADLLFTQNAWLATRHAYD